MTLQVVVPELRVISNKELNEKIHEKIYDELSLKKLLFNRFEDIFKELMPSKEWKIKRTINSIEIVENTKELDCFSVELLDNERTLRIISPSKISSFQLVVYMKTSSGLSNIIKYIFGNVYRYYSGLGQKI